MPFNTFSRRTRTGFFRNLFYNTIRNNSARGKMQIAKDYQRRQSTTSEKEQVTKDLERLNFTGPYKRVALNIETKIS